MRVGRDVYNAAKFVADMDFELAPGHRGVHLAEGEQHILTMRLDRRGPPVIDRAPFTWYCSRQERLVRVRTRTLAHGQVATGGRNGHLQLGTHPVADELRSLGISEHPIASYVYLAADMILPARTSAQPTRTTASEVPNGSSAGSRSPTPERAPYTSTRDGRPPRLHPCACGLHAGGRPSADQ
jgi:hypothetical protein